MSWQHIRLNLGRTATFPDGSNTHGYDIVAPITNDGSLDEAAWRKDKKRSRIRRFWHGEPDEVGNLIHTRHRTWAFSYAPGEDDDEVIFHLETHKFNVGEYITITEPDGEAMPFKIVALAPLKAV